MSKESVSGSVCRPIVTRQRLGTNFAAATKNNLRRRFYEVHAVSKKIGD
jgi:hypothetical protein